MPSPGRSANDPHDLQRFIDAQAPVFEAVRAELSAGRKRSHWMWFIFPQIDGLGASSMSKRYAIRSIAEAKAYLDHPLLGPRLLESAEAALAVQTSSALDLFGSPDDMKLRSCATLFASVSSEDSVFSQLINKYFDGKPDDRTLQLTGDVHSWPRFARATGQVAAS
jgi:uncharacterized protein (DUF1810 family)